MFVSGIRKLSNLWRSIQYCGHSLFVITCGNRGAAGNVFCCDCELLGASPTCARNKSPLCSIGLKPFSTDKPHRGVERRTSKTRA